MQQLLLLRHATAEILDTSGDDFGRELNSRGRTEAVSIGNWLSSQAQLDHVLISTAMRAQRTWQIVLDQLSYVPQVQCSLPALYDCSSTTLSEIIFSYISTSTRLLVVGHNPSLDEFSSSVRIAAEAAQLRRKELPNAAIVEIELAMDRLGRMDLQASSLIQFKSVDMLR